MKGEGGRREKRRFYITVVVIVVAAAVVILPTCVGHRVTSPVPRGKGTPEMASNTELLPEL